MTWTQAAQQLIGNDLHYFTTRRGVNRYARRNGILVITPDVVMNYEHSVGVGGWPPESSEEAVA